MLKKNISAMNGLPYFSVLRQDAAFTLLEVMVAVAIIGMSFVSLLSSQSQSISIASISRFKTSASLLAQKKLTQIELDGFDQLSSGTGDFEDDFADYSWEMEVNELTEEETGITGSNEMLKFVTLKVKRGTDQVFEIHSILMADIEPVEKR